MSLAPAILPFSQDVRSGKDSAPVLNALTVDVEDYYHVSAFESQVDRTTWDERESRVVANTARLLEILAWASVQGTFFVLGWVADRHPHLVRTIQRAGHEIACHGYWHRLIYRQSPAEFRADLKRARDSLEDLTGSAVQAYRAPSFSITRRSLWALEILIEEGFRIDCSIYPTLHHRYGLVSAPLWPHRIIRPAGTLVEFPMPVYRRLGFPLPIGGGGYLRLFPYAFTRHGLRDINRRGHPFAVYLHPWEIDPNQPRLVEGAFRGFRHYVNLCKTEQRLTRLLGDFAFGTLGQVCAGIPALLQRKVP
jgi:polysaccharide deacetylase family protein (PEP-CTERM system associated)